MNMVSALANLQGWGSSGSEGSNRIVGPRVRKVRQIGPLASFSDTEGKQNVP